MVYTQITFEWDQAKARSNEAKHGVRFEDAMTGFDDPSALIVDDGKHSVAESRQWLIGEADTGQVVVVVFTRRHAGRVVRIISARRANTRERLQYEALRRFPV